MVPFEASINLVVIFRGYSAFSFYLKEHLQQEQAW